ncbi:lonely Cys domain-containing protein, partial [Streptomyces sp. NPDC048527]|uniref:lonely Cys domain-containing protein n=1 Tax=Streptomyces sp. NPDC048527 TaxID=3365568 RepID=UPI003711FA75
QVPFDEVTLLASYDPDLVQAPLKRDLVLTVPDDDLRDGMARETGRFSRTFSGHTSMLHQAGGSVLMATQVVPRRRVLGISRSGKPRPMAELWRVTDPRDVIPSPPGAFDETDPTAQVTFANAAPPRPGSAPAGTATAGALPWGTIQQGLVQQHAQAGAPAVDEHEQALRGAFGPDVWRKPEYAKWYDLVLRLNELRQASVDPVLRRGPLDLAEVARYALSMEPGALVEEKHYRDLLTTLEGMANEAALTLERMGAVYLVDQGAFDRRYEFTANGGRAHGRIWTPRSFGRGLDLSQVVVPRYQATSGTVVPVAGPSPWSRRVLAGQRPYVVVSDGGRDHVMVGGRDQMRFYARTGVIAQLTPMDPILQAMAAHLPIVQFVNQAGAGEVVQPRRTAHSEGRREVFSVSGDLGFPPVKPNDPSALSVATLVHREGMPIGEWIISRPGQVLPPDDTAEAWQNTAVSFTMVDREGNPTGRSTEIQGKISPDLEDLRRNLTEITSFRDYNESTRQYGPSQKLPSYLLGAYEDFAHGRPGGVSVARLDGKSYIYSGREHGRWLNRRASFADRPADARQNSFMCWAGTPTDAIEKKPHGSARAPFVADPLAPKFEAAAQGIANRTRRRHGTAMRVNGEFVYAENGKAVYEFMAFTNAHWGEGGLKAWRLVEPVPTRAELKRLSVVAGLDGDRQAAERLVYALRRKLDERIDQDPGYEALVKGAGALELMRRNDVLLRDFGPFTLDLLEWAVRARRGVPARAELTRADFLHVLAEAAQQSPGTRLTAFLPGMALKTTAIELVPMAHTDMAGLAAKVLGLDGPQSVGAFERTRLLWALAKATAWIDAVPAGDLDRLSAKVLHGQGPRGAAQQRKELRTVAASVAAKGRDLYDERELAVGHLELSGAFGSATAVRLADTATGTAVSGKKEDALPGGRSWRGDSRLTSWSPNEVLHYIRHSRQDVRWDRTAPPPPWTGDEHPPYLLDLGASALSGHVELVLGGVALQVPFDEAALLASYDPELGHVSIKRSILLTQPHDGLRDGMAYETGRFSGTFSGSMSMSHQADGSVLKATQDVPRRRVLGVSRSGKPRPTAELWQVTDPRDVIPSPPGAVNESDLGFKTTNTRSEPQQPASAGPATVTAVVPSWETIRQGRQELRAEAGAPAVDEHEQALVDAFGPDVVRRPEYGGWYDQVVLLDELR